MKYQNKKMKKKLIVKKLRNSLKKKAEKIKAIKNLRIKRSSIKKFIFNSPKFILAATKETSKSILIGGVALYALQGVFIIINNNRINTLGIKKDFAAISLWEIKLILAGINSGMILMEKDTGFKFFLSRAMCAIGAPLAGELLPHQHNFRLGCSIALIMRCVSFMPYALPPYIGIVANPGIRLLVESFNILGTTAFSSEEALSLAYESMSVRDRQIRLLAVMQFFNYSSAYKLLKTAYYAYQGKSCD